MNKTELKAFCRELKSLLDKYHASLGVDIEGDTYGIELVGFFVQDSNDKQFIISYYSSILDSYDLKLFLKGE